MASSLINFNNIDETFPVAGTNNSSQGFRDNFSAIKSGLARAKFELTELREKAVLRSALDGTTLENDYNFVIQKKLQLQSYSETFYNIGTVAGAADLNYDNGNFQKITLSVASCFLVFSNFPGGDQIGRMILWVSCSNTAHKIILPGDVSYGTNGDLLNGNQIIFPSIGDYLIEFISVNNAANYFVLGMGKLAGSVAGAGGGGGGGGYSLPVASTSTLGGVKIDGTTIGIVNGVISVIGGVPAVSDRNIKTNITTITDPLSKIKELHGVHYKLISTGQQGAGIIAQDLEKVLPELVHTNANGVKSVLYGNMAGLFVEAIKALEQQVQELKQEISELKKT